MRLRFNRPKPLDLSQDSWVNKKSLQDSTSTKNNNTIVPETGKSSLGLYPLLLSNTRKFRQVDNIQPNPGEINGEELRSSLNIITTNNRNRSNGKVILSHDDKPKGKQRPKRKPKLPIGTSQLQVSQPKPIITPGVKNTQTKDIPVTFAQNTAEIVAGIFQFNAADPLGLKVSPLPIQTCESPEKTYLVGDEEGIEDLLLVSLDELNAAIAEFEMEKDNKAATAKQVDGSRKRANIDDSSQSESRVFGDPYAKTAMSLSLGSSVKWEMDGVTRNSFGLPSNKKIKAFPYRVPGPGGTLFTIQPALAQELEIEIEIVPVSDEYSQQCL